MNPLALWVTCIAGWMNRYQQLVIEHLQEEVRVLQEQLGRRPLYYVNTRRVLKCSGLGVSRPKRALVFVTFTE